MGASYVKLLWKMYVYAFLDPVGLKGRMYGKLFSLYIMVILGTRSTE